jgi:dihydropyrimidine dehydrogenase (NAD+) subunit PreT
MKHNNLKKRFESSEKPVNEHEATSEASRCLFCFDPPCTEACPAHVDVPGFIRKILTRNFKGAARSLYESNYFAGGCARVCPTDQTCEGACVLAKLENRPVAIARLQRFASDWALANCPEILSPGEPTGKHIAVIGAGPSGISCAAQLARLGHKVTIFEAREKTGGLFTHGIARYKVSEPFANKELKMFKQLGIRIKRNVKIGDKIPLEKLLKDFDAVFAGTGLGKNRALNVPGGNLKGVVDGLLFLETVRTKPLEKIPVGKKVVVIGGGNSAIDSAIAAAKLGAEEVRIVYRRTEKEMPAYKKEKERALLEGVHFIWLAAPEKILGKTKVTGIKCTRMKLGKPDKTGRASPVPIKGSQFVLNCDMVISALGQSLYEDMLSELKGLKMKNGRIVVNSKTGATSVKGLFAGGDCTQGGGEMVNAVAEGIRAANGINRMLSGKINLIKKNTKKFK